MSERFASGQNALAECDVCGFQYRLRQLKPLVIKAVVTGIKACPECWNPDQPQLMLGNVPNINCGWSGFQHSGQALMPVTTAFITSGFNCRSLY